MKLFILHGWTYQTETWQPLLRLLKERGIDFEFLLIPGLTDGTNPSWTLDRYVEWLREKTVQEERFILLGHSNGGRISIAFTATYPEKVVRLILEDSAGIPPRGFRRLKKNFFKNLSLARRILPRSERLRALFYRLIRENDYGRATPEMKQTLSNLASVDLRTVLDRIRIPTLIIWGAGDKTTPLIDGEVLHRGISGSRLHVIADARHSPHITHPVLMAKLIAEELAHS